MEKWPQRRRECLYYRAMGFYRLSKYWDARRSIEDLLLMEPENQQALSLRALIDRKVNRGRENIGKL